MLLFQEKFPSSGFIYAMNTNFEGTSKLTMSAFGFDLCCMLYTASVDCIVKLDCMFVIACQAVWYCMYISI